MKKSFYFIFIALVFTACGKQSSNTANGNADAEKTEAITSSDTLLGDSKDSLQVDGTTAATAKSNEVVFHGTVISPPQNQASVNMVIGGRVKSVFILPGQTVRKGQSLAVIENPEYITLQQTYLEAHAQVEFLKGEYNRQQALSSEQASPQKKSQSSKADYLSMKSKLDASAAQLNLLGLSPTALLKKGIQRYLPVKAPIGGCVSNLNISVGSYFNAGEEMCRIIGKSVFMLRMMVYEKDLEKLRVNARIQFRVNAMPGKTFMARIYAIGQNVDKDTRSSEVFARVIDTNVRFHPGMYVTARFVP